MTDLLKKGIVYLIVFCFGVAAGYFTMPEKVTVKTEIIEKVVEKVVETKTENRDIQQVTVEVEKPDGTKTKVTKFIDKTKTDLSLASEKWSEKENRYEKVTEYGSKWKANVYYKTNVSSLGYDIKGFGVGVERKVLGPIHVGGQVYLDKSVGVNLGIGF